MAMVLQDFSAREGRAPQATGKGIGARHWADGARYRLAELPAVAVEISRNWRVRGWGSAGRRALAAYVVVAGLSLGVLGVISVLSLSA